MIYSRNIYLKKIIVDIHVIESQKRDFSYTYILLIMNHDNKIRDIEDIDDIIYTEILDHNIDSDLYNIIINIMIHDSCDSKCMINGKYSKKYPRKFCDEMISNENDYPIYR